MVVARSTAIDPLPPVRRIVWSRANRIIAWRYPPVSLYERLSPNPAVWDAMIAVGALVNPRLRDEMGEIHLVAPDERVSGSGASFVMAPFTHVNRRGSRFSDGTYGVYYAARTRETAMAETAFHFGRFAADAHDPPRYEDFGVMVGRINERLHDLSRAEPSARAPLLDPDSYAHSQPWAGTRREAGSRGVHYSSVRYPGGRCIAIFHPRSVGLPKIVGHLQYYWDGTAVRRVFDYRTNRWSPIPT